MPHRAELVGDFLKGEYIRPINLPERLTLIALSTCWMLNEKPWNDINPLLEPIRLKIRYF